MRPTRPIRKASSLGAFFVSAACFSLAAISGDAAACAADRVDARAEVAYVYDGDTLRLTDGRNVRLIGIDTPELGREGEPSQPFARRARRALEALAGPGTRIGLRYDRERSDRHRRTLAHLYLGNGTSVEAEMLERGLATALTVPPNLWNLSCYAAAEAGARRAKRGIWSLGRYRPVSANRLEPDADGFRIVTGRVRHIRAGSNSLQLILDDRLAVRIAESDLNYFTDFEPAALRGRRVQVRGWLHGRGPRFHMRIRHPAALRVMD